MMTGFNFGHVMNLLLFIAVGTAIWEAIQIEKERGNF